MDTKVILIIASVISLVNCVGLLRTPKVYNAVITTDENLTPSRAFPVIQPTIHETGIATYPFAPFNPYRFFNPPPIVHYSPQGDGIFRGFSQAFPPREEMPVPPPGMESMPQPKPDKKMETPPEPAAAKPKESDAPKKEATDKPMAPPPPPADQRPPIPLNEFGLPPSLVPVHSFPRLDAPLNLQPFPYNNYPLIYDAFNQYQDHYLPPFGYYPPPGFGIHPSANLLAPGLPIPSGPSGPSGPSAPGKSEPMPEKPQKEPEMPKDEFKNIKNASSSKNSEVPDVPPPPIPSGAKTSE